MSQAHWQDIFHTDTTLPTTTPRWPPPPPQHHRNSRHSRGSSSQMVLYSPPHILLGITGIQPEAESGRNPGAWQEFGRNVFLVRAHPNFTRTGNESHQIHSDLGGLKSCQILPGTPLFTLRHKSHDHEIYDKYKRVGLRRIDPKTSGVSNQ